MLFPISIFQGKRKTTVDDVDLIVAQADCSREEAIKVLKKHNGDVIDTVMELSERRKRK